MAEQFIVVRMGCFPVTNDDRKREGLPEGVHEYWEEVQQFGPYDHEAAKRKAVELHEATGDNIEVRQADNGQQIAVILDGQYFNAEQHDEEGDRLPQDEGFDFWE